MYTLYGSPANRPILTSWGQQGAQQKYRLQSHEFTAQRNVYIVITNLGFSFNQVTLG